LIEIYLDCSSLGFTHCSLTLRIVGSHNQFHSYLLSGHRLLGMPPPGTHLLLGASHYILLLALVATIHREPVTIIVFCSELLSYFSVVVTITAVIESSSTGY
jgi:hypothetical protein